MFHQIFLFNLNLLFQIKKLHIVFTIYIIIQIHFQKYKFKSILLNLLNPYWFFKYYN